MRRKGMICFCFLLSLITISSGYDYGNPCPKETVHYAKGNSCLFLTGKISIKNISDQCTEVGATHVIVDHQDKHEFIQENFSGRLKATDKIYIALKRQPSDGKYVWRNGVPIFGFQPWKKGATKTKPCVAYTLLEWEDVECGQYYGLCEIHNINVCQNPFVVPRCRGDSHCIATEAGKFECECNKGFSNKDGKCVRDCNRNNGGCQSDTEVCENVVGAAECICRMNFELGASGKCKKKPPPAVKKKEAAIISLSPMLIAGLWLLYVCGQKPEYVEDDDDDDDDDDEEDDVEELKGVDNAAVAVTDENRPRSTAYTLASMKSVSV